MTAHTGASYQSINPAHIHQECDDHENCWDILSHLNYRPASAALTAAAIRRPSARPAACSLTALIA